MKNPEAFETRKSADATVQSRSQTGAPRVLALLLLLAAVAHAEVGNGLSSLFNVDTRWGGGTSLGVSGFFTVDTRFSGSTGEGSSGLFTVDTSGAGIGSAGISGYVRDGFNTGLSGATVTALQNGVLRAQTVTDFGGAYALVSLPEGTYQVQAAKTGYLTVNHYGVSVAANQSMPLGFLLTGKPAGPAVVVTTRPQEPVTTVVITNTQLKKFNGTGFVTNYTIDLSKKMVVFTHGWNSNPNAWAANMAASGVANANLLAWD